MSVADQADSAVDPSRWLDAELSVVKHVQSILDTIVSLLDFRFFRERNRVVSFSEACLKSFEIHCEMLASR